MASVENLNGKTNTDVSDLYPNVHTSLHCIYTVEQNESK